MEEVSFPELTYTQNLNPQIEESTFLRNFLNLTKLQDVKTLKITLWYSVRFPLILVHIKYIIYNSGSQNFGIWQYGNFQIDRFKNLAFDNIQIDRFKNLAFDNLQIDRLKIWHLTIFRLTDLKIWHLTIFRLTDLKTKS
jgi:pectate lyase